MNFKTIKTTSILILILCLLEEYYIVTINNIMVVNKNKIINI